MTTVAYNEYGELVDGMRFSVDANFDEFDLMVDIFENHDQQTIRHIGESDETELTDDDIAKAKKMRQDIAENYAAVALEDAGGGYTYMFDGLFPDQIAAMTDAEIRQYVHDFAGTFHDVTQNEALEWLPFEEFYKLSDAELAIAALIRERNNIAAKPVLDSVMTAAEAAEELGLAESTVRMAISRGQIPGRKSGGTWLVRRVDTEGKWSQPAQALRQEHEN